ncbi:MAG TPA: diguanylate cyclase [Thauera sp.]|nr:diguanylate cyclase [Thauera sp.]
MAQPIDMKRFAQLKAAGDLPSPRGVAIAIIRLTQSADVSMAELGRVIKGDPAFVGRLVKAANGLVAENRRAVVSVQEALMVMGLPAVRTMALGFSLLSHYRKGGCAGFDYPRFWSSSLLMALAMQALMQRVRVAAPDEAFSLGLLARVGELALATLYPDAFSRLLAEIKRAPGLQQVALEDQAFAMNHRELGAAMLLDWGLPEALVQPVRFHESPELAGYAEGSRESGLVQCLVLSRAIAQLCLAPVAEQERLMPVMLRLSSRLGLGRGEFINLCDRVGRDWGEWGKLLQIRTETVPRFGELGGDAALADAAGADETAGGEPGAAVMPALVVVRDAAARAVLSAELKAAGLKVFEAASAQAALELAIDVQPQMVLVDWVSPSGSEGEKLVRGLRDLRLGRCMHILAILPREDDALLLAAAAAGADDFAVLPLRGAALGVRLRSCLRMLALQHELEHEREELRNFAAELAISNRRLQEAALTDPLTGLPNRRHALESMQMEWAAAARHGRPLAAMIIDLDAFKAINDTYGHDVGDIALRQSAELLREALRAQDVICRTGGDEFLVICPDTDLRAALTVAERLRVAAESRLIDTGGPQLEMTVSIGIAEREAEMANVDALIKVADQGAYVAKQQGRNRVVALQAGRAAT